MAMYGRVPEYHRANFGNLGRIQRMSNAFAGAGKINRAGVVAEALLGAAGIAAEKARESEDMIQKAFFEQSRMNVESGLASLASKYKFDAEGFDKAVDENRSRLLGEVPEKKAVEYAAMFDGYKTITVRQSSGISRHSRKKR